MKKQLAIISTILATAGMSAFGQGFVTFQSSTHELYDEFTTAGGGTSVLYPANGAVDVTFLWAATGTADTLSTQGTLLSGKGGSPTTGQVATNGVTSISFANSIGAISNLLSTGWSVATVAGGSAVSVNVADTTGSILGTQFQLANTTGGSTYEFIVVAWNAASGSSFGSANDIGWSNPFNYTTGATSQDPAGQTLFSSSGMNQFGISVVGVPEPTTLALAGLGGLSTLFLRRRKS